MIRALLWKESREHLFKLLALCAIFGFFFLLFYFEHNLDSELRDLTIGFFFPTCWMLPVWLAASTVTSEKNQKTAAMLAAMPVRTPLVFLIKTLAALATMLLPLSLLILGLATGPKNLLTDAQWLGMLVGMSSLYLMITALAAPLERETAVAMLGVLFLLLLFLCVILIQYVPNVELQKILLAPNPLNPFTINLISFTREPTTYQPHLIQLIMAAIWWNIALFRNTTRPKIRPQRNAIATGHPVARQLALPPSSIFRALAWREFREQGWIIAAAGVSGMLFAIAISILTAHYSGYSPSKLADTAHMFAQCTLSLSILIPAIVAIILGINAWTTDVHSKLFDFWRSRPISSSALFWSKFLTSLLGVLALLVMFCLTSLAASAYAHSHGLPFNRQTDASDFFVFFTTAPLAMIAILATTIAITLLIRHPLYAAIIAIVVIIVVSLITAKADEMSDPLLLQKIQIFLILATIAALALAHRALTRNWQLKSSAA